MKVFDQIEDVRALRNKHGLNQTEFWAKVGITQPGGSRYEVGQSNMPKSVRALIYLIYIKGLNLKTFEFVKPKK